MYFQGVYNFNQFSYFTTQLSTGTSMTGKPESIAIFLTSASTSDEDSSDVEGSSLSSNKRMKTDIDFGTIEIEINKRQLEETHTKSIPTSHNTLPTKLLPIDPILILKDRPNKPALKSCTIPREEKDIRTRLECDCVSNCGRSRDCLNSSCKSGTKSCVNLYPFYFS